MLKTLIGKQMKEVWAFLYYDAKKGKRRSSKGLVGYGILMFILFAYVAWIFGMAASWIGKTMFLVHVEWLYWLLMGLISIAMGVFGSVFNTFSTVYLAKDNEMLLAMPIKKQYLLIARLSGVYALGLFYAALVYIPSMIVAWKYGGFSLQGLLGEICMLFVVSLIVLSLSALLGWGVAIISMHLKNKAFVTVFVSLLFIVGYYYIYFKATNRISDLIQHADTVAKSIQNKGFFLYHMGQASTGKVTSILIQLALALVLTGLIYLLLRKNFTKILTMKKGEKQTVLKEVKGVQKSVDQALLHREVQRFTKSAGYMLNCGLGTLMIIVMGVMAVIKADRIQIAMNKMLPEEGLITAVAIAIVCLLATMNDITAPSISMEGKSLWIAQSMPVSGWQVLKAKLKLHIYVTLPAVLFCGCCIGYAMKLKLFYMAVMLVMASMFVVFSAANGLMIGLKWPNLTWSNETAALKQSLGVFIALFGNWALIGGIVLAGYFLRRMLSVETFMGIVFSLVAISNIGMIMWLKKSGSRMFAKL